MQMVATGAHDHALVGRRRRDVEHHRLHRSDDVRAVRRRRRRGGAVAGRGGGAGTSSTSRTRSTAAAARRCACRPAAAGCRRRTRPSTSGCTTSSRTARRCSSSRSGRPRRSARRLLERNGIDPSAARPVRVAPGQPPDHRRPRPSGSASPPSKVVINLEMYGNTTAGDDSARARRRACARDALKKGDLVLLASVGAGFTVGAVLLRWSL